MYFAYNELKTVCKKVVEFAWMDWEI